MKLRNILFAAAAAVLAAACSGKPSETTSVNVKFAGQVPASLTVRTGDAENEVPVADGAATFEVPTDPTAVTYVICGDLGAFSFIPDGAVLTVDANVADDGSFAAEVTTDKGPKSVQGKYAAYGKWLDGFYKRYSDAIEAIDSLEVSDEEKEKIAQESSEKLMAEYKDFLVKSLDGNGDNYMAADIIRKLYGSVSDEELEGIVGKLSDAMKENAFIKNVCDNLEKRRATREGAKFTDFTVKQSYEYVNDSGDTVKVELPTVSLSDYVGNGKYVLVDFWASWCGHCKREIPNLKQLYDKYHGDRFDIVSVAISDEPQSSVDTAKAYGVTWNQIVNTTREPGDLYGIEFIPHIILIGPDGTILKRPLSGEELINEVSKYLD